jgi:hypothetical protein
MRTLTVGVTGPTGQIGRLLMAALERTPQVGRVIGMARPPFDPTTHGWRKVEYRQGDILDRDALDTLMAGGDVAVHLGFIVFVGRGQAARSTSPARATSSRPQSQRRPSGSSTRRRSRPTGSTTTHRPRAAACRIKHLGEADAEVMPQAATGAPPLGRPAHTQPNDDVRSGEHGSDRVAA